MTQLPTPKSCSCDLEELQTYPSSVILSWLTDPKSVAYQLGMVLREELQSLRKAREAVTFEISLIIIEANESPTTILLTQMA